MVDKSSLGGDQALTGTLTTDHKTGESFGNQSDSKSPNGVVVIPKVNGMKKGE